MSDALAPNEEAAPVRRLHPASLAIGAIERLPSLVLGLPAVAYFAGDVGIGVAILLAIAGLAISIGIAFLHWLRFSYQLGDAQLVIESGIMSRNRRSIPFDRIQDVSLEQTLLARIFGVSIVRIETGSSGSDEGKLECVSRDEADRLRDVIRRHRSGAVSAEAAEAEEAAAPILFSMNPDRLLTAGLFNFSLVFLAVIGVGWQYFGTYLPGRYLDPEYFIGRWGDMLAGFATLFAATVALAALLVVGMVTGIVRTFLRDYGFELTRTETGLRRIRGLLTRTDVVMPLRRVQAAIVSTGIVRRRFGWEALSLQSLGTDGDAGTSHVAAPFARRLELLPIFGELALPEPPAAEAFTRVSRHMVTRSWIEDGVSLAVTVVALSWVWAAAIWFILLVPVALVAAIFQYRAHGWRFDGEFLFVRRGVWKPRTLVLRREKVQSATVVRTPLQSLFGTATLVIGTAGAPLASPLKIVDLELPEAQALMDRLLLR